MTPSTRVLLVPALLMALLMASGCSGMSGGGDDRATGASRSGVEVFGTIDAGVSRTDTKR
jgi:hypothetical protein